MTTPMKDCFIHLQYLHGRFSLASVTAHEPVDTGQHYADQILRPHIVPFFMHHHSDVFQKGNTSSHTARVTMDFLHQHNIRAMAWPALILDWNPVEHLWEEIQTQLNQVVPKLTTCAELEAAFLRVWVRVPMAFVSYFMYSVY